MSGNRFHTCPGSSFSCNDGKPWILHLGSEEGQHLFPCQAMQTLTCYFSEVVLRLRTCCVNLALKYCVLENMFENLVAVESSKAPASLSVIFFFTSENQSRSQNNNPFNDTLTAWLCLIPVQTFVTGLGGEGKQQLLLVTLLHSCQLEAGCRMQMQKLPPKSHISESVSGCSTDRMLVKYKRLAVKLCIVLWLSRTGFCGK